MVIGNVEARDFHARAFQPFELENWQSDYEQTVRFNLSDSTIEPLALRELLGDSANIAGVLDTRLYYPEVNGERSLREVIAGQYAGTGFGADDVLVTIGASEANAALVDVLCGPGDRVVVMEPGYRQVWGLARNAGCDVRGFPLVDAEGWRPDLDLLDELAVPGTKVIYVCNPNNPTGYILTAEEMDQIVAIAERSGAWLIADEVYQGSEHDPDAPTPTFLGRSERVVAVNSMSKSYGLSGLRIGWAVGPRALIRQLWRRHEYMAIATGRLDNVLAELALTEPVRSQVLQRNRAAVERGWKVMEAWAHEHRDVIVLNRPAATPLAFPQLRTALNSVEACDLLRKEASVLVCPGVYFGGEGYFRLNFGFGIDYVTEALAAMTPVIRTMAQGNLRD